VPKRINLEIELPEIWARAKHGLKPSFIDNQLKVADDLTQKAKNNEAVCLYFGQEMYTSSST
jgi:hypothetical protein